MEQLPGHLRADGRAGVAAGRLCFVLAQFSAARARARAKYVAFVHEGSKLPSVWSRLQGQIYLGSDAFVNKMQALVDKKPSRTEVPRAQRREAATEAVWFAINERTGATEFLGYDADTAQGQIVALVKDGKEAKALKAGSRSICSVRSLPVTPKISA